ncbi:hypothetical protein Aduo_013895 [Ancylostoma duodenale]
MDQQQEPTHNRRLREMFRLFQRTKKQKEKAVGETEKNHFRKVTFVQKERAAEEEQKQSHPSRHSSSPTPSKRLVAHSPHSPSGGQKTSKEKRRSSYVPKKQASAEETTTVVDDEDVVDESASAKKRRQIRKKYGIHTKDEEFFQRASKDDVEEFENVAAAFRPAATKMRKAKLRWKRAESPSKEKTEKEQESSGANETAAGTSWDELTAEKAEFLELDPTQSHEEERTLNPKYAEKYAKLKEKPQEKIEDLLKEIYALLVRVDELEQAQSKFLAQIRRLRSRVALRDKKINDLSRKIESSTSASASVGSVSTSAATEVEKTVCDEEKPSPKLEAVALRGLDIMKRNQLLEQTVNEREAEILVKFFESEEAKPDKMVVMLIDKAFNYGLEVLLMRPDLFEDYVDNELRLFLLDAPRAKHVLLDCMLSHPEYVPVSWGGNILAKRHQERQKKAEEAKKQQEKPQEKSSDKSPEKSPEKPKPVEESAVMRTTRSLIGFLFDPKKWTGPTKEEPPKSVYAEPQEPRSVYIRRALSPSPSSSSDEKRPSKGKLVHVELKPEPKSEAEKRADKAESKSEYEKKAEKVESKSEYERKGEKVEPKSETERRSDEKVGEKEAQEIKRAFAEKRWKYRATVKKTPPDTANTAWVQDRAERRHRAKLRLKRPKKKN